LAREGCQVLNEVVLNQVLVSFGSPERTRRVIERIQSEGTCWCGGTVWQGPTAMRIRVPSRGTDAAGLQGGPRPMSRGLARGRWGVRARAVARQPGLRKRYRN